MTVDAGKLGRDLSTAVISFHQAVADHLGLSAADHKALEIITREGPLAAGALARRARLSPSSTTALVDRLASAGYVRRQPDRHDRRRVVIAPTVTDHPAVGPAYAALAAAMAAMMRQFPTHEQQVIHRYVTATTAVLDDETKRLRGLPSP